MNKEQLTILLQADGEMARRIIEAGDHEMHLNMSLELCKLINERAVDCTVERIRFMWHPDRNRFYWLKS